MTDEWSPEWALKQVQGDAATRTIDPDEAGHFGALAGDWWDPKGRSAMLHRLNPVRLRYIREQIDHHWKLDETELKPLAGRRAADIGCGAGLLAEPLARLGAEVTGLDAAPENIEAARAHAKAQGLAIDYRIGGPETLGGRYDLVTAMEVIEHVADPPAFVAALGAALGEDGILVMSTPNRTALSRLLLVGLAEATGHIPKGTHDWEKFLTPAELAALLAEAGLEVADVTGIEWSPLRGFTLGQDKSLDYLLTAVRA
ncbi:MAG: bifunctional 2-polyprenyl-6-hydroxyphenol methylase/3-demethylubiquinol 3-O-methyltransferase UbiG [Sphingomonadaceae bacterium]